MLLERFTNKVSILNQGEQAHSEVELDEQKFSPDLEIHPGVDPCG